MDSQGFGFLGKIVYSDFIACHVGETGVPLIEIATGKKIGTHKGYWFYTICQRKGLGMSGGPWFGVKKNIKDNVVYVSNGYDTRMQYGRTIPLEQPNWISTDPFENISPAQLSDKIEITFKTRHSPEFLPGYLIKESDGLRIQSDVDVQGIAPGQFAVIYTPDHNLCLGSAMITIKQPKHRHRKSARPDAPVKG